MKGKYLTMALVAVAFVCTAALSGCNKNSKSKRAQQQSAKSATHQRPAKK